jgi:hypothetical protein
VGEEGQQLLVQLQQTVRAVHRLQVQPMVENTKSEEQRATMPLKISHAKGERVPIFSS